MADITHAAESYVYEPANLRRRRQSRFSRYGSTAPPPATDDAVTYPADDHHGFFAKGRDFESICDNHKYTIEERIVLSTYDSLDYLPSHSTAYTNWIKRQPPRLDWDRWLMMGFIGFAVGIVGFFLHQLIDLISILKWKIAQDYIREDNILAAWGWTCGYSVAFVIFGTALVVFIRPSAASSGIPELIGFLNGTLVRHIFNIKTMVVKFFSCCAVVGAGLPVGPEGPMIHLGSLIGAGLSQFKSDTLKFNLPFFERFRNSEDRRNFISAGAAAGVASAFGAPVGGLLFSMEEVSSFWNLKLSWQIFFCAMVSTFTTDLLNSAFHGFRYSGKLGLFMADKYILFQVKEGLSLNILTFIPSVLLGILGGLLGSVFNFINLKIARTRKRLLANIWSSCLQKAIRLVEPVIIMVIMASVAVFFPSVFNCTAFTCIYDEEGTISKNCLNSTVDQLHVEPSVSFYTCPVGVVVSQGNFTYTNNTYSEMATLLFVTGEQAIHHLFSRSTHLQFGYYSLSTTLVIYFFLACWTAGTSISSGVVVPMLLVGALYGRLIGRAMVDMFGIHTDDESYWNWIDPGAFALIGAASFFGGVSRLTMSLTVIMMEITNDIQFLLPIMASIMVAKWVGDQLTHPLYHALLELKCIPFLDAQPVIMHDHSTFVNLELFAVKDVMATEIKKVRLKESVAYLANLLLDTAHGGFPVVKLQPSGKSTFFGFINRMELIVLLKNDDMFFNFMDVGNQPDDEVTHVEYQQMTVDILSDPEAVEEMLVHYSSDSKYQDLFINLEPYVNQSAVSLPSKFSLHRSYIIFRTLGLRHLTITDEENRVVGLITRKDLMGFHMEEKLSDQIESAALEMDQAASRSRYNQPQVRPPVRPQRVADSELMPVNEIM